MDFHVNGAVRRELTGLFDDHEYQAVEAYYGSRRDAPATPLRQAPRLAAALGVGRIDIKDESSRFGLSAFKIVGARYAAHRLGGALARGIVCATAGNHGRAVARVARDNGVPCTIFVPAAGAMGDLERDTRERRIRGMKEDGAAVVQVDGSYEEAVRRAAARGESSGATIVSDVSWPGYDTTPRWIMAGYTHILEEAAAQWEQVPDVVLVQGGVGGLVCAAASWLAHRFGDARPRLVACEPEDAACLLESARAGSPVVLRGEMRTMMAGLRCAAPSPAAWPAIAAGTHAFVSIPDSYAVEAMRRLRAEDPSIDAGPSGACGVGATIAIAREAALGPVRAALSWGHATRALAIVTEGP